MRINREYMTERLVELVSTDSVNPSLVPGSVGEAAIAAILERRMRALGLEVKRLERHPGRPTVVGVLKGTGRGRSLMWNAHIDTVGVDGMADPFSAEIRGDRLYGRGAYDMKGSVAACLAAVEALQENGCRLQGDLVIAAVADEEYASLGTEEVLDHFRTDGAVVTEPTGLDLCLAHKGFIWFEIVTEGRAAHGSQAALGIDANLHMGGILGGLAALLKDLTHRTAHPLVGSPSLHAAMIAGGTGLSTYAAHCHLQVERRTVPGEGTERASGEIREILERLAADNDQFQARMKVLLARDPFEVDPEAPIVKAMMDASRGVLEKPPAHTGENPWMDSALLSAAGIETVVMGPAGEGAHATEEWVELRSVAMLAEILAEGAKTYCGA